MTVEKLERAVRKLPPRKLVEFSRWFEQYRSGQWDEQIESDAKAGRLDKHIEKAREQYRNGKTQAL